MQVMQLMQLMQLTEWNLVQTLTHVCDHCSYLGMNPCTCGETEPQCNEPRKDSEDDETAASFRSRK